MKVITGTVVRGRVEIPRGALMDGSRVAVLAPDPPNIARLTRHEQDEIEAAVEEIRRGDCVDGEDLLHELRGRA